MSQAAQLICWGQYTARSWKEWEKAGCAMLHKPTSDGVKRNKTQHTKSSGYPYIVIKPVTNMKNLSHFNEIFKIVLGFCFQSSPQRKEGYRASEWQSSWHKPQQRLAKGCPKTRELDIPRCCLSPKCNRIVPCGSLLALSFTKHHIPSEGKENKIVLRTYKLVVSKWMQQGTAAIIYREKCLKVLLYFYTPQKLGIIIIIPCRIHLE